MVFCVHFRQVKLNKCFFGILSGITVLITTMTIAVAGEIYYCSERPDEIDRLASCPDSYIYKLGEPTYGQEENNSLPIAPDRQVLAFIYGQFGKSMPEYCRVINNPLCLQAAEAFTQKYLNGSTAPEDNVHLVRSGDGQYLFRTHKDLHNAYTNACARCIGRDSLFLALLVGYVVWSSNDLFGGAMAAAIVGAIMLVIEINEYIHYPTRAALARARRKCARGFLNKTFKIPYWYLNTLEGKDQPN